MSEFRALYAQFIDMYSHDLAAYAKDIHGIEFDPMFHPIVEAVQRGDPMVAIKSGHGVGKTTFLSAVVSWYCNTRANWRIPVTAPTAKQLEDALWPEIRRRFQELPGYLGENFEVKAEKIVLRADPDACFVSARTASKDRPEALQGIHQENVLIVVDEAAGVPDEVFEAGLGSMSTPGAQSLFTGNPTKRSGFFFRLFTDPAMSGQVTRFTVNAERSPWADPKQAERIALLFGRDSNEYRYRILGEFPDSDDESFIHRNLVLEAFDREIIMPPVRPIWSLDPARFGRDKSCFTERFGPVTEPQITWNGMDTMHSVGFIVNRYRACFPGEEPSQILIDVIGIGAGIVDRLGEIGLPVVGVNVAESPPMGSQGYRLRDELWIRGRDELYARRCKLSRDPELADQLAQPTYEYSSDGRVKIESKEAMKKRLGVGSPDKADSWLLGFAGDASVVIGQAATWGRPLRAGRRIL